MMRRLLPTLFLACASLCMLAQEVVSSKCEQVYPGVWCYTFGTPEKITPTSVRRTPANDDGLNKMATVTKSPVIPTAEVSGRGTLVSIPLQGDEQVYGFGLQMQSFQQRGGNKKLLRVNADPQVNTGDSHAPVPFYVTTSGYGVLIDVARYVTVYMGNAHRLEYRSDKPKPQPKGGLETTMGFYKNNTTGNGDQMLVEVPHAQGVKVYVFGGPTMRDAVARYNLFSGGGALPPRWGLGFWYRMNGEATQDDVLGMAKRFHQTKMPCDVLGLEPHWQTEGYSCSYKWSNLFPDPAAMTKELGDSGLHLNLWLQGFVRNTSPIYPDLFNYSGNYEVWGGEVPDFLTDQARRIWQDYHERVTEGIGVSGYKVDECDNSDFTGGWSFPEVARFPSGADGEQMHCLFGIAMQSMVRDMYKEKGRGTYDLVRNSGALAAPYPFVLYSDLYDHQTFINSVAQAGFCGLLWCPEVRDAGSETDLLRRLQSVVCSPLAMINAWFLRLPPWIQMDRGKNNDGVIDPNSEKLTNACRQWINLRMQLVPYLHAAFVRYHREGIPPFRALIMDYPDERDSVKDIAGQYMMGDNMMVAPLTAGGNSKNIYFPKGVWYDFFTGERIEGGRWHNLTFPLDRMPLYVKGNTLLPLAHVTETTSNADSRVLNVRAYGADPQPFTLYADDGSANPPLTECRLEWNAKKGIAKMKSGFYKLGKEKPTVIK